jgi:hypothetical protein
MRKDLDRNFILKKLKINKILFSNFSINELCMESLKFAIEDPRDLGNAF